jgi:hypothetical protein
MRRWGLVPSNQPTSDHALAFDPESSMWGELYAPLTDVAWSTGDQYQEEVFKGLCRIYAERLWSQVVFDCRNYARAAGHNRVDEAVAAFSRAYAVFTKPWQPVSGFRERASAELERIGQLPAGWDGYGAPTIDPEIVEAATALVQRLPDDIAPPPRVVPLASGGLQLEWASGDVSLELEFESPSTIRFLKWNPLEGEPEEDSIDATNVEAIKGLIHWYALRHV